MAVKMPDLVAYGERVNKTQNNSGGVQMPNLVAYGKRVETRKAKETKAVTPSASPRPMENASTGNSRPNSRLLADVRTGGTTPPSLDNGRVGKVISGAAKSAGSAFTNLGGVLAEGAGKLNTRIANQNAGESLQSDHDAVKRYEKMLRDVKWANGKAMTAADVKQVQSYLSAAKRRIAAHEGYTKAVERSDKAVADKAYQKADRLSQSSAADVAQAKEGLGPVGQFAVDLGVQGVQMAGDVAASAVIPGAGLALMTARSAGSSAQRARQAGATYNQQLAYGLGSGALSLATEKISNVASPFKKAFGGGVLDNAINGALSKLNNSAAGRVALSMISEGGEEFIEDVFQPVLQRATYDPSARFDLSEALYDAAVGAAMGGIGAGVDVIRQRGNGQADAQPTQEGRPEVREGIDTPTPANAAEGTQNAAPGVETAANGNVIKIDAGDRANPTSLATNGDAGTQSQASVEGTRPLNANDSIAQGAENVKNGGAAGFDTPGDAVAGAVNTPFDTMQAKSDEFYPVNPNSAQRIQADQRRAPSEVPVVNPDTGRNVEKTVSTILNSPLTSPEMATVYENAIAGGAFDYDVVTDRSAVQQAQAKIARDGWREVANSFIAKAELGQRITKADTAEAISAYNLAISEGDHKAAFELATAIADAAHDSAQMVQAMNLMNRLTPEGRLLTLRRLVDRMNDRAARQNRAHDTQNSSGLDEQANADLNHAMQESLDAAQSLVREIYEALQDRNGGHRRTLEEIISRFPQYRNLARYFSEIDNYIREERASGWVESLGRELAKNVDQRANPKPVRERTVYETVSSDLNAFMRQYIDNRQQSRKTRTAAERLTDFFNNRKEYAQAWKTAQNTLRSRYANNRDMLDRLEEFINGTIGYNARGSDAVMMRAVADAALQEDVKLKELVIRRRYDLDTLSSQIADRLIQQTGAEDSNAIIIRDAVKRYVQEQYERNPKNTQKYISNDIKASMRDFQITLSEILTQNIKSKNELANRISNALVQKYKISQNGAEAISNDIATQFSDMVQEASRKKIEQLFQNRPKPVQKTALQRFTEYANLGVFSTAHNEAATERLFGMQARIDPTLAESYVNAETDAERAAAWDAITTSIADQIPSTFMEKANFWRYTSMLTNPTTHIRNIMGNAIQMGARKIKNGIGTAIERAVIKDPSQRTKAVNVDKDLKAFAKGQYETDQSAAMGSGKYSDATAAGIEREIQSKRKMFKGEDVLSRAVQGIGDLNSRALDYEDVIFNRAAYVDSFAQALQAKGVTAAEAHAGTRAADVEAARAYAIEEAQKATYRNTTALSEALSKRGRYDASDNVVERGISFVTDALLPFRKTPANILTTGLSYSPVELFKVILYDAGQVHKGNMSATDMVDHISSGLTGTGIFALGAYLAAEGLLHIRAGDDDKEEAFEKSMGGQDYAIQIGDKSYTLDWALPAAMPLFAGAATMKSVQKGGGTFVSLVDAIKNIGSVIWETSMLSALNDLISYWSYADDPGAYLISKAASSYAGQYIPTIGSKVASVFDDTVRKSYVEKGSGQVASDVNYFLQGAAKKVPGARNQLQPLVDMWGNEVSNGSAPERVFQSFLSPGFLKAQDNSPATQEIRRLAKATGDSTVYPAAAEKSYTVKGETRTLTGKEYTRYAKAMGQTRKDLVEAAVKLPAYKSMSNAEKVDYIQNVYKYARETARQQVDPKYEPSAKWIENAKTSKRDIGVSTGEFLALYQKYGSEKMSGKAYEKVKQAHDAGLSPKEYFSMKDRADADGNGRVSKAEASAALAGQEHRADLWDIICTTNAKNPYK